MRNWEWEDGHSSICKGPSQLTCASSVPASGPVKLEVGSSGEATSLFSSQVARINDGGWRS